MYLWSQQQNLPLSPGIVWTLFNGKFRKNILDPNGSLSSLQWLYYEQTKYNERIHHAYHQGEKTVYGCRVDGYAIINGIETVWEYNGCHFHGCPCIPNPTPEQKLMQRKWIERKAKLESKGCRVIEMTCCKWIPFLNTLNAPQTEMGRILLQDNQVYTFVNFTHLRILTFSTHF